MFLSVNNEPPKKQHKMQQNVDADRANEQKEQLLDRIQAYHGHIYECTAEMTCETRTAEYRAKLKSQQALIRAEVVILRQQGTHELERANRSQAQAKQQEAKRRERVPFQPMRRFFKQPFKGVKYTLNCRYKRFCAICQKG